MVGLTDGFMPSSVSLYMWPPGIYHHAIFICGPGMGGIMGILHVMNSNITIIILSLLLTPHIPLGKTCGAFMNNYAQPQISPWYASLVWAKTVDYNWFTNIVFVFLLSTTLGREIYSSFIKPGNTEIRFSLIKCFLLNVFAMIIIDWY